MRVRRETGKALVVQVHCFEGVAIHIGPEPCTGLREEVGEASAGEPAPPGQAIRAATMCSCPEASRSEYDKGRRRCHTPNFEVTAVHWLFSFRRRVSPGAVAAPPTCPESPSDAMMTTTLLIDP